MKNQIEAVLSGVKDKAINKVGHLWQIRVGARAGARENGISLARDLLKEHREDIGEIPPQPLTAPLAPVAPATDYERIIEELKAQLAEARAPEPLEADDLPIPEFLKTPEPVPSELSDIIDYADTPVESNEKLLVRLREVLGLIGLAEDAGGRAAAELYRKKDRLESGIRWNRGRLAGTL
jgi:hypothetical protein